MTMYLISLALAGLIGIAVWESLVMNPHFVPMIRAATES